MSHKKASLHTLLVSVIACLGVRLFPFHIPNVEPLMAFYMPLHKRFGFFTSSVFAAMVTVPFDLITGHTGLWTLINVITYSLLGLVFPLVSTYCTTNSFVYKAIAGTLLFDIITGICVGPLFFHQSFIPACLGQIPFTIMHLISNILLAFTLSPLIDHWIVKKVCDQTRGEFSLLGKKVL
ncbi:MAG: hypothetical protein WCT20_05000 [Candidatus Babeliales bacterium]|jgi:hypothetical protein